jgi:hypothetical protein
MRTARDHRAWQVLFCFEKGQPLSSAVARADSDRRTSVVEPDLQTVRVHMIACASTLMASSLRRLVATLLRLCFSRSDDIGEDIVSVEVSAMKQSRN